MAQNEVGAFIPTTDIFTIASIDQKSPQFKELIIQLYQTVNDIAMRVNISDAGYYVEEEFVCGQLYYPNPALTDTTPQKPTYRQVFRKVIKFGALPNTATKTIAHSISPDSTFTFTRIYGTATDTTAVIALPLPYSSPTLAENIKLYVDGTNVSITTGNNRSSYDTTYVVLEYIKQ